jgi:hypothetical protein
MILQMCDTWIYRMGTWIFEQWLGQVDPRSLLVHCSKKGTKKSQKIKATWKPLAGSL